jgi:hypothetical protein
MLPVVLSWAISCAVLIGIVVGLSGKINI